MRDLAVKPKAHSTKSSFGCSGFACAHGLAVRCSLASFQAKLANGSVYILIVAAQDRRAESEPRRIAMA